MGHVKIRTKGRRDRESFMTKGELRSMGIANEKKERKVIPLLSGRLMGERGNSQWKNRRSGTTWVVKGFDGNCGDVFLLGRGG